MMRDLETCGFSIQPAVLDTAQVSRWSNAIAPLLAEEPAGLRQLGQKLPELQQLIMLPAIQALVEQVLGSRARLVRAILFNKSNDSNWQVGWHQDLSISVKQRADIDGFSGWSMKESVQHVQAPVAVLEKMLTLRLHLDPADADNGALWVVPGSHRQGRIPVAAAGKIAEDQGKILCAANAGDVLLMRPLLLHASFKASNNKPRRVIHLEFSAMDLPAPLRWHDA